MLFYPRCGCGSTACHLFVYLLVCVSQADLEPVPGSMGALLVSQCYMTWRSFVQVGGSVSEFCFFLVFFFSSKCGSSVSARFLINRVYTVRILPLVSILDPTTDFCMLTNHPTSVVEVFFFKQSCVRVFWCSLLCLLGIGSYYWQIGII
jgi:hypothetical protein